MYINILIRDIFYIYRYIAARQNTRRRKYIGIANLYTFITAYRKSPENRATPDLTVLRWPV